ncbi:MAG: Mth938-like domain-containing protein [Gammaproteobacteria bacterium]
MKFIQDKPGGDAKVIRAYAPGRINVNDVLISHSFILSPDRLLEDWAPQQHGEITLGSLQAALELKPEILIIGTGSTLHFPEASIMADIQGRGIGLEVLDTAAACRTYNVLVSENRNVVAALLMI